MYKAIKNLTYQNCHQPNKNSNFEHFQLNPDHFQVVREWVGLKEQKNQTTLMEIEMKKQSERERGRERRKSEEREKWKWAEEDKTLLCKKLR